MSSTRRARKSITFAAAVLLLSGCGPTGFNVGVERLISNVVFGVFKPKPQPSPQVPQDVPFLPPLPQTIDLGSTLPVDNSPCPVAPPGTPAVAADTNVSKAATNGQYKWYSSYTRTTSGSVAAGTATSGFETRAVEQAKYVGEDVSSVGGQPDYVYTWVETKPDPYQPGYSDELTFQAHTYSNLDNPPATPLETVQYGGNYDPYGGINLTDLKRFKGAGKTATLVEEFAPNQGSLSFNGQQFAGTPGLLIFTLPVPGASTGVPVLNQPAPSPVPGSGTNQFNWQASASDPANKWTESISAVEGNQRVAVDACGAIVYGWPVTATLTISKTDPATGAPYTSPLTITWKYVVAPQYGGLIVSESIDGDGGYGSAVKTQEVLGSLQIAPLPKGS